MPKSPGTLMMLRRSYTGELGGHPFIDPNDSSKRHDWVQLSGRLLCQVEDLKGCSYDNGLALLKEFARQVTRDTKPYEGVQCISLLVPIKPAERNRSRIFNNCVNYGNSIATQLIVGLLARRQVKYLLAGIFEKCPDLRGIRIHQEEISEKGTVAALQKYPAKNGIILQDVERNDDIFAELGFVGHSVRLSRPCNNATGEPIVPFSIPRSEILRDVLQMRTRDLNTGAAWFMILLFPVAALTLLGQVIVRASKKQQAWCDKKLQFGELMFGPVRSTPRGRRSQP
jgi:hypothetical protein